MRTHLLAFAIFLAASSVQAKEYGNYDPKRMLTVSENPAGKSYSLDTRYLDQMLNDLGLHAKNYPPNFDTPQDQQRATRDVQMLSGMLDILIVGPTANTELLLRAGFLNSMGHNLNIAGSAQKAAALFQRLLAAAPADPRGNFMYGTFLAGVGKPKEGLPFLEKALAAGLGDAAYALGMTYLSLGEKNKALEHLESYRRRNPGNPDIDKLIGAIRNGKVNIQASPV